MSDSPSGSSREHTIHQYINEQDLHGVEWVGKAEHGAECDERERSNGSTQLEGKEVGDVMED